MRYIFDTEPGICSQADFDHDFQLMMNDLAEGPTGKHPFSYITINERSGFLLRLAIDKGYRVNWPK